MILVKLNIISKKDNRKVCFIIVKSNRKSSPQNIINNIIKAINEVIKIKQKLEIFAGTPDKKTYCIEEKKVMIINEIVASNLFILYLHSNIFFHKNSWHI